MPTTPPPASDPAPPDSGEVEIRPLHTRAEYAACVDLQRDTWGRSFSDIVPLSLLQIAVKMGGVCIGAFGPDGGLRGFVFGVTGPRRGELAHWSHMLAVRPEFRDNGIGRRLKVAQADALRALGVNTVCWTFDPLVARNAHFNINRLGAKIDEYVPDMYGESDSDLHQLGTDRFIAKWCLDGEGGWAGPDAADGADCQDAEVAEVVVPGDIEAVEARSVDEALEWRRTTRRAFTRLLGAGGRVAGFVPGREHGRYVVEKGPAS